MMFDVQHACFLSKCIHVMSSAALCKTTQTNHKCTYSPCSARVWIDEGVSPTNIPSSMLHHTALHLTPLILRTHSSMYAVYLYLLHIRMYMSIQLSCGSILHTLLRMQTARERNRQMQVYQLVCIYTSLCLAELCIHMWVNGMMNIPVMGPVSTVLCCTTSSHSQYRSYSIL